MAQKVKCVKRYVNTRGDLAFEPGHVYELPSSLLEWLMRDAPDCFQLLLDRKAMHRPARDKALHEPPEDK